MDRRKIFFLLLLILAGGAIRYPQVHYGSPVVRDPDSIYTVGAARYLAIEWKSGTLSLDPKSYFYPTCYTNILTAIALVTGTDNLEEKGRTLSILSMLATIIVVFFLGMSLSGISAGFIGASIISLGFQFVKQGIRPSPDSLQLFFIGLALYFLVRNKNLTISNTVLSGLFTGFSIGTKFVGVLFVFPVFMSILLWSIRTEGVKSAINYFVGWLFFSTLGFFISSPQFFFQIKQFLEHMVLQRQIQKGGGLYIVENGFWALLLNGGTNFGEYPFVNSIFGQFGFCFVVTGFLGLGWGFVKGCRKNDPRFIGVVISCVLTYIYFALGTRTLVVRYLLPWTMMMVILISVLISDISTGHWHRMILKEKLRPPFIMGILTVVVLWPSLDLNCRYVSMLLKEDSRVSCAQWVINNIKPGAKILNFMYGPALPANRYAMVQWVFPEYAYEISSADHQGPSVEKLQKQSVNLVIWNNLYTRKFLAGSIPPQSSSYIQEWHTFYQNLNRISSFKQTFHGENDLGPVIEVFGVPDLQLHQVTPYDD